MNNKENANKNIIKVENKTDKKIKTIMKDEIK